MLVSQIQWINAHDFQLHQYMLLSSNNILMCICQMSIQLRVYIYSPLKYKLKKTSIICQMSLIHKQFFESRGKRASLNENKIRLGTWFAYICIWLVQSSAFYRSTTELQFYLLFAKGQQTYTTIVLWYYVKSSWFKMIAKQVHILRLDMCL